MDRVVRPAPAPPPPHSHQGAIATRAATEHMEGQCSGRRYFFRPSFQIALFQSLKKSKSASLFTPDAYLGSELSRRSTHSGDLKLRGVYFHRRRIWERG